MTGFYQVSDKVPSSIITSLTSHREHGNYRLSARMGVSNYHDKDGILS